MEIQDVEDLVKRARDMESKVIDAIEEGAENYQDAVWDKAYVAMTEMVAYAQSMLNYVKSEGK